MKKVEVFKNKTKELSQSENNLYNFIKEKDSDTDIKRAIIDYIAGQTDQYFLNECIEHIGNIDIEQLYK